MPYLKKLARKLKYDVMEKPRKHLKYAKEQLNPFSKVETLANFKKEKLKKLLKLQNKKLEDLTSNLSKRLASRVPETYKDMDFSLLPSLESVKNHVGTVMSRPEIIPSLAKTITKHVMGKQSKNSRKAGTTGLDDMSKPTTQLINDAGFLGKEHQVITSDGYILTIHRIINPSLGSPHGKPVVFLQHGLLSSSADWIIGDRKKAFGFLLADAGYDVWLGNFRGNMYSRNHTTLDPDQEIFWRFSWDQMGEFDLPAMLHYVKNMTGRQKILYVGHSMGTTAFWVMMNRHPEMNSLIKLMVGMAPVAASTNMYSPIKYIAPVADQVERMLTFTGQYEFGSRGSLFSDLSETLCSQVNQTIPRNESACSITENMIFSVAGFDAPQMNFTLLPVIIGHTPAGTSARTLLHFAQGVTSQRFCQFDYESKEANMEMYGVPSPPDYSLGMVTCPVLLYWGENDWLAHPKDVAELADKLPNLVASVRVPYDSWNHLDFLWGKDADQLLYTPAMQMMAEFS